MPSTNIKITATDKTQRAFQSAQRSVGGLKKSIVGLKGAVGMIFGAVAIGKLIGFSSQLMDTADSIDKMSARLQVSSESLQGLNFNAQLAGSSVEGMQRNIQKFVYAIGQAQIGTKAQADEFNMLGIDLKKKNGEWKDHTTVFNEVADAYGNATSATRVLTSSQILFGRGGRDMVNMMMMGSEGIERFNTLLRKSGGIMGGEFLDATVNYNDSMTLWGKIMGSNTSKILTPFIEKILEVSDAMFEMKGVNPLELSSMKKLIRNYNELEIEVRGYKEQIKEGIPWYKKLIGVSIESTKQEMSDAIKKQDAVAMMMLKQTKLAEKKKAIAKAVNEQATEEIATIQDISLAQQKMYSSSLTMAFDAHAARQKKSDEEIAKQKDLRAQIIEFRRTEEQQVTADIMSEHARRKEIILEYLAGEGVANTEKNALILANTRDTAEKLKQIDQEKRDSAISTSKEMIASMGSANKSWFQANKALAISDTIMATYTGATKALAIPPPWVGIGYASMITGLGMANVNRIRQEKYQGRAMGGSVNKNQSYIVGERGRELFTPNQSGNITPNNQLGGVTNINFNIKANDARGFDALLQQRRGMIVSMINKSLNERGRGNLI